jgi:Holliday junction DNA helicase RuvA
MIGFGFLTELERQLFERLIAVSGIGPKLAVAVLSGIEPREFVSAVNRGDVVRLTRVPGIGKKTAERMVLELKDRLQSLSAPVAEPEAASGDDRLRADLVSALQNLGYHRPQAEKAIETTLAVSPEFTFEQALKSALRELMR